MLRRGEAFSYLSAEPPRASFRSAFSSEATPPPTGLPSGGGFWFFTWTDRRTRPGSAAGQLGCGLRKQSRSCSSGECERFADPSPP